MAYLGIPLVTSEGHAFGTFAVIDTVPREWTPDDVDDPRRSGRVGDDGDRAVRTRPTSVLWWNNACIMLESIVANCRRRRPHRRGRSGGALQPSHRLRQRRLHPPDRLLPRTRSSGEPTRS